jgi:hypothetical protein
MSHTDVDPVQTILDLFQARGTSEYGGEAVTQEEHALQTAACAMADGGDDALVAAALLHDIGHLLHDLPDHLVKKDLRERRDGSRPVGKHAPQSLRHRDHPLPHGHRRDDVISEVGGGLGHVAAVARRADAAALVGEGHDESRAARHADRAGEAEAEDAALEIAAEFVLDVSRHGPLAGLLATPTAGPM